MIKLASGNSRAKCSLHISTKLHRNPIVYTIKHFSIVIMVFSLITLPTKTKSTPEAKDASTIPYGYRKCGTYA